MTELLAQPDGFEASPGVAYISIRRYFPPRSVYTWANCISVGSPVAFERPRWRTVATTLSPASRSSSSWSSHSSHVSIQFARNCAAPSMPRIGLPLWPAAIRRHVPDEVGVNERRGKLSRDLEVLVAASDDLHVLLRHRPSSIPGARSRCQSQLAETTGFLVEAQARDGGRACRYGRCGRPCANASSSERWRTLRSTWTGLAEGSPARWCATRTTWRRPPQGHGSTEARPSVRTPSVRAPQRWQRISATAGIKLPLIWMCSPFHRGPRPVLATWRTKAARSRSKGAQTLRKVRSRPTRGWGGPEPHAAPQADRQVGRLTRN
jgi:hypothetical protein